MLRLLKAAFAFIAMPTLVISVGVAIIVTLNIFKPKDEKVEPVLTRPVVAIEVAEKEVVQLSVRSQGEVAPLTEIDLTAQVSGKVAWVSSTFKDGGVFKKGELLLEVERRDYELGLVRAQANLARAKQAFAIEEAESDIARKEWEELQSQTEGEEPSALTLREPQLALAQANYQAALAEVQMADLNLQRTRIRAPFDGRVRSKRVDFGQFISTGAAIGRVFSTEKVEIKLPLTDTDLAQLEPEALIKASTGQEGGAAVVFSTTIAGELFEWPGRIVRTDASIDPTTQQMFLIAEVDDPYGAGASRGMPLAVGLFVTAEIVGRQMGEVVTIPRSALLGNSTVAVLSGDNIVREVTIDVQALTSQKAIIGDGVSLGDRVVVSRLGEVRFGDEVTPRPVGGETEATAAVNEKKAAPHSTAPPKSSVN